MSEEKSGTGGRSFKSRVKRGLKRAVALALGDSDLVSAKKQKGDLPFDGTVMEILEIDIDEANLPRAKVFKLNLTTTAFFNRLKKNLHHINCLYMVCSDEVIMQYDALGSGWEKRLIEVLNGDFSLDLQQIHLIRESDILNLYNQDHLGRRLPGRRGPLKTPYHLSPRELLIVAGGFINFRYTLPPLLRDTRAGMTGFGSEDTIAGIELEYFRVGENLQSERIEMSAAYPVKYQADAAAYFYIGGEWYHNLFVPEFFDPRQPRYICFRIDDDGRYIRFFPDSSRLHIPICVSKPRKEHLPGRVRLTYAINPEYIAMDQIMDFTISICYESEEEAVAEEPGVEAPGEETSIETLSFAMINREIESLSRAKGAGHDAEDPEAGRAVDPVVMPRLHSRLMLLPRPGHGRHDIPAYSTRIGPARNPIVFSASSDSERITITLPGEHGPACKKSLLDPLCFTAHLGGEGYTFSNEFLTRLRDEEIRLYFAWTMESTLEDPVSLTQEFYVLGRDPGRVPANHRILLADGDEDLWRIGTSRAHALLLRGQRGYSLYNLSTANSVFIIPASSWERDPLETRKIPPLTVKQPADFLEDIFTALTKNDLDHVRRRLKDAGPSLDLSSHDRLMVGNRVYEYVVPVVVQSPLADDVRNDLRTLMQKKTVRIPAESKPHENT